MNRSRATSRKSRKGHRARRSGGWWWTEGGAAVFGASRRTRHDPSRGCARYSSGGAGTVRGTTATAGARRRGALHEPNGFVEEDFSVPTKTSVGGKMIGPWVPLLEAELMAEGAGVNAHVRISIAVPGVADVGLLLEGHDRCRHERQSSHAED